MSIISYLCNKIDMMQESKQISSYRQSLREKIIVVAIQAFAREGIKAVKMDTIAHQLGISKRTLYEIYDNKEDLIIEGLKWYQAKRDKEIAQAIGSDKNVIDIILFIYKDKVEEFHNTNPLFYSDLEKYPRVIAQLANDREQNTSRFMKFIECGIEEGFFRRDVDYHFVSMLFDAITHYIMSHQIYRQSSIEDIFHNLVFVTFRGFCTQKGIEALDDIMKKEV